MNFHTALRHVDSTSAGNVSTFREVIFPRGPRWIQRESVKFLVVDGTRANSQSRMSTVIDWLQRAPGELFVQDVFRSVLARSASDSGARAPLVLDIGANAGFYGLLSLAFGARVAFFDAQPGCWRWISEALQGNRQVHGSADARFERAQLVRAAVATSNASRGGTLRVGGNPSTCAGDFSVASDHRAGRRDAVDVPMVGLLDPGGLLDAGEQGGGVLLPGEHSRLAAAIGAAASRGTSGTSGGGADAEADAAAPARRPPASPPLISLVKLDVEGMELGVLEANLLPLLAAREIEHLVVEVSPLWWSRSGHSLDDGARLLHAVSSSGYSAYPFTLTRCASDLWHPLCASLLPHTMCAGRPEVLNLTRSAAPHGGERHVDDERCSQLNASSSEAWKNYLMHGVRRVFNALHEKLQEDVYFRLEE